MYCFTNPAAFIMAVCIKQKIKMHTNVQNLKLCYQHNKSLIV